MNLIEQLGGYDVAKSLKMSQIWLKKHCDELKVALLEYRRQHNIFEVGDKIVHPKFNDKNIYEILKIRNDLFTVYCFRQSHSFKSDVRHATDEEIAAGRRL